MEPPFVDWVLPSIAIWVLGYGLWRMLKPDPVQPPYDWSKDPEFLASLHEYTGSFR